MLFSSLMELMVFSSVTLASACSSPTGQGQHPPMMDQPQESSRGKKNRN